MRARSLVALIAMLVAAPAQADITARYAQPDSQPIIVEVRDNGDSRIVVNDGIYVSARGEAHLILTDARGTFVARQADFVSLMEELMSVIPLVPSVSLEQLAIEERGTETVGGRSGRLFRVGAAGSETDVMEVVISEDRELAPVGRAMATLFAPVLVAATQGTPGLAEAMAGLLARGTVLRFGHIFTLAGVERAPVSPAGFELPSAPLSREALIARLQNPESSQH